MPIDVVPPKQTNTAYPATIWASEIVDGDYGPQVRVKLVELNGNKVTLYLSLPATPGNRTGRVLASLMGGYPEDVVDEGLLVGMTVNMFYAVNRRDATKIVLDMLEPRKPGKGEDPAATVAKLQAEEDQEAPF